MAQRIEAPIVSVPAGTLSTAPQRTGLSWQDGRVVRIEVKVPPGPSGLVGFALGHSGQVIIPRSAGQWIIADDDTLDWDTDDYPTGNKWFMDAYNTDIYPHSLFLRIHIEEHGTALTSSVPALDIRQPDMPTVVTE